VDAGDCLDGGDYTGSSNTALTEISNNGNITGYDNAIYNDCTGAGSYANSDGDANTATLLIQDNGNLMGQNADGIGDGSETWAGSYSNGTGDHNTVLVEISGNGNVTGGGDIGIISYANSGGDGGESDSNTATTKIHDNGDITGVYNDGIYVESNAGDYELLYDGDHNTAETDIQSNGEIRGMDGDGIDLEQWAGGGTPDSLDNHTVTQITGNGAIVGETGDGIDMYGSSVGALGGYYAWVCCYGTIDTNADSNTVNISNNTAGILGMDGDGIRFDDICCSLNTVTIMDNAGTIQGQDGEGINYYVDGNCGPCSFTDVTGPDSVADGFPDAIQDSLNLLTISGNDISGSSDAGIWICCGAFDAALATGAGSAGVTTKSAITDNTIENNGENGIFIDTSQGLNIGPANTITGNGYASDDYVHAGIQIVNDLADFWDTNAVYIPSDGNTITQNMIYDNHNAFTDTLGIDLNPDDGDPRVGCLTKDDPISPNACIQAPVITLVAEGGKVGGTTCALCTVELFSVDSNPPDQPRTVSAIQNGEGAAYLASGTADDAGNFTVTLPCGLPAGDLTATATDKVKNTSEFSLNRPFLGTGVCATATPTASDTPTPTNTPLPVTPTPAKACGDVNDNGSVDAVDAQLVLQYSAGLVTTLANLPSGDVNSSGGVNPVDAALILQVEAGLIPLGSLNCM
jgi:hypothetical protein